MTPTTETHGIAPGEIARVDALSQEYVVHFYKHDLSWCLSVCDPQVSYLGSTLNAYAMGYDALATVMNNTLSSFFPSVAMSIESLSRALDEHFILTLVRFYLITNSSSGRMRAGRKRGTMLWGEREGTFLLRHAHFSSPYFATTYGSEEQEHGPVPVESGRLVSTLIERLTHDTAVVLRDARGNLHRISPHEVRFIEAQRQLCTVHCLTHDIVMRRSLTDLLRELGGELIRTHRSFAVNPSCVRLVRRDAIVLDDDSTIPIPQRRSKAVRTMLEEAMRRDRELMQYEGEPHMLSLAEGFEELQDLPPLPGTW